MKNRKMELQDWYKEQLPQGDKDLFVLLTAIVLCKQNLRIAHKVYAPIVPNRREIIISAQEDVWAERLSSLIDYIQDLKGFSYIKRKKGDSIFYTQRRRTHDAYLGWFRNMKDEYDKNKEQWYKNVIETAVILDTIYPPVI